MWLGRLQEDNTRVIKPERLRECVRETRSILDLLRAGHQPDVETLSTTFGAAVDALLSDVFSQDGATSRYWTDGVAIDVVRLLPDTVVRSVGRVWCGDHRDQWPVPVVVDVRFGSGGAASGFRVRVGDAAFGGLGEHRGRSITRSEPQQWLIDLEADATELHAAGGGTSQAAG